MSGSIGMPHPLMARIAKASILEQGRLARSGPTANWMDYG